MKVHCRCETAGTQDKVAVQAQGPPARRIGGSCRASSDAARAAHGPDDRIEQHMLGNGARACARIDLRLLAPVDDGFNLDAARRQ